jgi:hypothetical protein
MTVEPVKLSEDLICIVTAAVFQGHPGVDFVKIVDEAVTFSFQINRAQMVGTCVKKEILDNTDSASATMNLC